MASKEKCDLNGKTEEFILLHPITWKRSAVALGVFSLFLLIFRWKAVTGLGTYYLGGSHADAGLYLYLFRHHLQHLFSDPFFSLNAFFPYPNTLAWSDNFIFPSLLAMPFYSLGISESALYSLVLLLAHLATAYCIFRLVVLISNDVPASLIAGVATLALGYITHSLGHPQLQFLFCFPLAVELLIRSVKRPIFSGVLFGAIFVSTFLTTVYFAVFLSLFPILFYGSLILVIPRKELFDAAVRFVLATLPWGLLLIPFALPYMEAKEIFGARALHEMYAFRTTGLSFMSAPPLSILYGFTSDFSHAEAHFFPGIVIILGATLPLLHIYNAPQLRWIGRGLIALFSLLLIGASLQTSSAFLSQFALPLLCYAVLAIAGILFFRIGKLERQLDVHFVTTRALFCTLIGITLVFVIISLGPTASPNSSYQLSPFALLHQFVPGFDAVRAISRAAAPALLSLTALFGLGIWQIRERFTIPTIVLVLIPVLVTVENLTSNYALEPRDGAPAVAEKVREIQRLSDATLFLPMTDEVKPNGTVKSWKNFALRNVDVMNWSVDHDLLVVNGYSGQRTKIMKEIPGQTVNFPDGESLDAIARIANVRYIIFGSRQISNFDPVAFRAKYEYFSDSLELLEEGGEGYYLFRFNGETRLSKQQPVRAPSHLGRGVLSLEVKSPYEPNEPLYSLNITELDHGEIAAKNISLPSDGLWHQVEIPLPKPIIPGLPFRFQIGSDSAIRTTVRNISAVPKQ
ncbi:MAG: hypothetical protein KDD70_02340 [Bdellovibrionales bacterium]|nr:hypothetical protein [Bdellovibrionales bacterium]